MPRRDSRSSRSSEGPGSPKGAGPSKGERPTYGRSTTRKDTTASSNPSTAARPRRGSRSSTTASSKSGLRGVKLGGDDDEFYDDEFEALTHDKLIGVDERRIPVHMRETFHSEKSPTLQLKDATMAEGQFLPLRDVAFASSDPGHAQLVPYAAGGNADDWKPSGEVVAFEESEPDIDYDDQAAEQWEQEWAEAERLTVDRGVLGLCGCLCLFWALATSALLAVFLWRYLVTIRADLQKRIASSALLEADAAVAVVLAPAASVLRALTLQARGGALGDSLELPMDRMQAVMRAVDQQLMIFSEVTQVKLADAFDAFVLRPGQLSNNSVPAQFRKAHLQWQSANCSTAVDLPSCYGLVMSGFEPAPSDGAAAALWSGPAVRKFGPSGDPLPSSKQYDHRLTAIVEVATANGVPTATSSEVHILEARINVGALQTALRQLRLHRVLRDGIEVYLCRFDGLLLASSEEAVTGLTSVYDSPSTKWAHSLDRKVLSAGQEQELWQGGDLLAVRPAAADFISSSSLSQLRRALRVVALVPRAKSTGPWLERFAFAAGGLAGVFALALVFGIFGCFCCICCMCCCKRRVKYVKEIQEGDY